jgi:hypothetical protein
MYSEDRHLKPIRLRVFKRGSCTHPELRLLTCSRRKTRERITYSQVDDASGTVATLSIIPQSTCNIGKTLNSTPNGLHGQVARISLTSAPACQVIMRHGSASVPCSPNDLHGFHCQFTHKHLNHYAIGC